MAMYHINPTTGNVNECMADEGNCPFGDESEHYPSRQEGRRAYEETQDTPFAQRLTKSSDEYSRRLPVVLKTMIAKAPDETTKGVYTEALQRYAGQERHMMHRFGEIYRQRGEVAYRAGALEEAAANHRLFMLAEHLREYRSSMNSLEEARIHQEYRHDHDPDGPLEPSLQEREVQQLATRTENTRERFEAILRTLSTQYFEFKPYNLLRTDFSLTGFEVKEIDGSRGDLREVLAGADDVYPGRVTMATGPQALKQVEATGEELAQALAANYELSELGSLEYDKAEKGPLEGAEAFELIAGGSETNVYLHRPTMMVYKVRHADGLSHESSGSVMDARKVAIVNLEKRYQEVDNEALDIIGAEYLKTYFIAPKTPKGEELPMLVQPFLDPSRYGAYDPSDEEATYLSELGFNDAHAGNMSVDSTTGRVVLFDCIFTR